MGPLETLLWVYPLLLLLNGFVAIALWTIYRRYIFGLLVGVWASTLLNFAAQGALIDSPLSGALAFSSYIVTAWFLVYILCCITHQPFSFLRYWVIYLLALCVSVSAYLFGAGFAWVALPLAIAVALPQVNVAFKTLTNNHLHSLVRIFAIVLLVNGLHFIDYPFLRPIPEAAIFGYSLVIATSMLFGVLLPCIINNFLADELTQQLRDEVNNHQKTAMELEQALDVAEQALSAKAVFLANVSHHLRTPINGIMGLNDLLLDSPLDPAQKNLVRHVRASSSELLGMVDNVLTISLLESEKVKLYPKAICIQQLINDIFDHYAACGPLPLRLTNRPDPTHTHWIYADVLKIRQILFNIIDNALKHSNGTYALIDVSLKNECLHITLMDDGIGVTPDQLENLALPFKQEAQSIHTGMGLGLSIVRELVTLLEGKLQLESGLDEGFRVHCEIPVQIIEGEVVAPSAAASKANEQVSRSQQTDALQSPDVVLKNTPLEKTTQLVLVVEDNPVNRMVISGMLKKLAVAFCMAEDGAQAMAMYHEHQNNLACILMDVQLPDANGLDLVEQIRAQGDHVPVLVISAFTFGNDEARALEVGADAYLRKPYHFDEFKNALGDLGVSAKK
ncbi:hybrid sensor histidine kinase/response regulator [Cellvibrio mixtus]|uniref:hybrid sensor histidine kinase/response regulator n=1 Tax=Cellvibrio mixtus TaxID=39650 RepID=UPI000586B72B|nr:response regulator [Cellvibrio mixtus]